MKALVWQGINRVGVERVPDPTILQPTDAIVRVTATAICGSDLHLLDGYIPSMVKGDILGHEFMGEVVEVGSAVRRIRVGDRVIVPFPIACGKCWYCQHGLTSLCDNSNPNPKLAETLWGYAGAGIYGYSHITGGYAGGQAQFARTVYADANLYPVPEGLTDEQVLFLTDILPTGYMAAEHSNIQPGDVVTVFGAGPVGLFTVMSAFLLGAGRVISIDRFDDRLKLARQLGAETINYEADNVFERLKELTGGRGPDSVVDAVGMESHGTGLGGIYDAVKQTTRVLETERPHALRAAIMACRKGGTVSVPGVYGGLADKIPVGALMNKGLTLRTGQTHVHRYLDTLTQHILRGDIDPTVIITHRLSLDEAPRGYQLFKHKHDGCIKCVLDPWADPKEHAPTSPQPET
ncbi:Zn-dependent alcohol dehydrogenase [Deinococcus geothermalis DSM 11300]|uniref:Zn-dependent alcohol dehydrogenase n=1 Tax=Deinococcus geothermalis (strain DSM 11300 / CIP 105573 / AG-3a) TaxID=319795 RepID=Q1J2E0_DEIGD|nr:MULTISPECIES: zinc-dependent alcohol dehydrogenase [Deinococcus]ABF44344.1 Zn-dependent alcohol dehydrogenase [Deinococcus geothermalis DSM 11300]MBI0445197.1 glutathione-dependent formaldehyde dehydrogenase [Deinococcus sp. DB0503]